MTPSERFRALCGHFGGGNPTGGIWMIGWEEAGEWSSKDHIDRFIADREDQPYDCREPGDPQIKEWKMAPIVSKICHQITGYGSSWENYRDTRFLTAGGDLFMTNLYPIARKAVNVWPKNYSAWFGFETEQEYRQSLSELNRFDNLSKLWSKHQPRVTICYGKGIWNEYRDVLKLGARIQTCDSGNIEQYRSGIFLTPHLSRSTHMPDNRIDLLTSLARECWWA
jgi:hypothetical protein